MKIVYILLFTLTIPLISIAQRKQLTKSSGWYIPDEISNKKINIDPTDSMSLISYAAENPDTQANLINVITGNFPENGAVHISFDVMNYINKDTSKNLTIYLKGQNGKNISIYHNYPIKNWITNNSGRVELTTPYENGLDTISYGILSEGKSYIDLKKFKIKVDSGEFSHYWKAENADRFKSDTELVKRLSILCKTWGFLKYFSKKISQDNINWDKVLLDNITLQFELTNNKDFNKSISKLIKLALDPDRNLKSSYARNKKNIDLNLNEKWLEEDNLISAENKKLLADVKNNFSLFDNNYVKNPSTFTPSPLFIENSYDKNFLPNLKMRLLSFFRFWNIINYYYPYKYLINENWDSILIQYIPIIANATSSKSYLKEIMRLNSSLNDGHSSLSGNGQIYASIFYKNPFFLPAKLLAMDDEIYVKDIDSTFSLYTGIHKRSKILKINNVPSKEIIGKYFPLISHGKKDMKVELINSLNLLSYYDMSLDSIEIEFQNLNTINTNLVKLPPIDIKKYLNFYKKLYAYNAPPSPPIKLLNENTLYLNAGVWKKELKDSTIQCLRKLDNVIIDTRNYTTKDFRMFSRCFTLAGIANIKFMTTSTYPGLLEEITTYSLTDTNFYYKGNVIVLISEKSQSASEFLTMLLLARKEKLTLIGRPTYGVDGDVTKIPLVGYQNISIGISGTRVLLPNNQETQNVGIMPNILIKKNMTELLSDEDLILKKALEFLKVDKNSIK